MSKAVSIALCAGPGRRTLATGLAARTTTVSAGRHSVTAGRRAVAGREPLRGVKYPRVEHIV